ncbi:hypothetical protein T01_6614 [Trichinella spiralis]|uniref:Uncharacterized protein n=1 Tax=Trichinella spiralis TaxID=6334 RepID=A0A0V0Z8S1_TRISP|nr:hypothetical protein T01_6614 [Trichinella spiralis]
MFTSFRSIFGITNIRNLLLIAVGSYSVWSSDQIPLSQSSSVRTNPDNVLVLVAVSAFPM